MPKMPELNPVLVQKVHEVLCWKNAGSDESRGHELSYGSLDFILWMCQREIAFSDWDNEAAMLAGVQLALRASEKYNFHGSYAYTWTLPASLKNKDQKLSMEDVCLILTCTLDMLKSVEKHLEDGATSIAEHHGGILRHASIHDLMTKLATVIDISAFQNTVDQISALQATLFFTKFRGVIEILRDLQEILIPALRLAEDAQERGDGQE
jgi:hypothetical protein